MFDTLQSCYIPPDPNRPPLYHIFHIASSPPDDLEFPQYNQLPELDRITWDTLPSELQKVSISFKTRQDCVTNRFSEKYQPQYYQPGLLTSQVFRAAVFGSIFIPFDSMHLHIF